MFLNISWIIFFLKRGTKFGWCDYKVIGDNNRKYIKNSKYIYELYNEDGEFITETFGARKMEEYIKEKYPNRAVSDSTINEVVKTGKIVKGFIIKRRQNPYKANRDKKRWGHRLKIYTTPKYRF